MERHGTVKQASRRNPTTPGRVRSQSRQISQGGPPEMETEAAAAKVLRESFARHANNRIAAQEPAPWMR